MIVPLEKPGTPEELVHFGRKGMKWGVRKERTSAEQAAHDRHKSVAKKVAIGVGVGVIAVGAAYTAHKLHQNGHLKLSGVTVGSKKVGKKSLDPRIAEQIKNLQAAIKHPDVPPEGKQEARDLLAMLKSIQ